MAGLELALGSRPWRQIRKKLDTDLISASPRNLAAPPNIGRTFFQAKRPLHKLRIVHA
jgi:hypothetical protein